MNAQPLKDAMELLENANLSQPKGLLEQLVDLPGIVDNAKAVELALQARVSSWLESDQATPEALAGLLVEIGKLRKKPIDLTRWDDPKIDLENRFLSVMQEAVSEAFIHVDERQPAFAVAKVTGALADVKKRSTQIMADAMQCLPPLTNMRNALSLQPEIRRLAVLLAVNELQEGVAHRPGDVQGAMKEKMNNLTQRVFAQANTLDNAMDSLASYLADAAQAAGIGSSHHNAPERPEDLRDSSAGQTAAQMVRQKLIDSIASIYLADAMTARITEHAKAQLVTVLTPLKQKQAILSDTLCGQLNELRRARTSSQNTQPEVAAMGYNALLMASQALFPQSHRLKEFEPMKLRQDRGI